MIRWYIYIFFITFCDWFVSEIRLIERLAAHDVSEPLLEMQMAVRRWRSSLKRASEPIKSHSNCIKSFTSRMQRSICSSYLIRPVTFSPLSITLPSQWLIPLFFQAQRVRIRAGGDHRGASAPREGLHRRRQGVPAGLLPQHPLLHHPREEVSEGVAPDPVTRKAFSRSQGGQRWAFVRVLFRKTEWLIRLDFVVVSPFRILLKNIIVCLCGFMT